MTERSVVVMGLPESGKTTFLAALWHLIEAGEVQTKFVLDRFEGDSTYLNEISKSWRNFEKVPRTTMQNEQDVILHLRDVDSGEVTAFAFPDLSGESFDQQVEERRCRPAYISRFTNADGIILFITANRTQDDRTIVEVDNAVGGPAPEGTSPIALQSSSWTTKSIPTQVRLVEILQFLLRSPFSKMRRRVAVVISAWDVVSSPRPEPELWLERELPLLSQYLTSNQELFSTTAYGVSAQGVDLVDGDVDRLAALPASERIVVQRGNVVSSDLTAPIVWLIENG